MQMLMKIFYMISATNSPSASGKSKGGLLFSANIDTKKYVILNKILLN